MSSIVEVDVVFSEFGDEALDYVELEDEVLETIISSPHGIVSSTFAGLATIRSVSACSDTPPSLKMSFFMNYFGASFVSTEQLSKVDENEDNFKHSSENYETCAYKPELWPPDFLDVKGQAEINMLFFGGKICALLNCFYICSRSRISHIVCFKCS